MADPKKKTIYVNYVDIIDLERTKYLMDVCARLIEQQNPTELYFSFASNGGGVDAGIALYNFLKGIPVRVIMHNIGSIDSIANVIFIAGDERYAAPHSTFLFHGVKMELPTSVSLGLEQMNELSDRIENNHTQIAEIVCQNSKIERETIKQLFLQGETKGTDFALEHGIISEIKPLEIPQGAPFISINYQPGIGM